MLKRAAEQEMEQVGHLVLLPDTTERRQPGLVYDLQRRSGMVLCHISQTAPQIIRIQIRIGSVEARIP
jgi:hypothetical protein